MKIEGKTRKSLMLRALGAASILTPVALLASGPAHAAEAEPAAAAEAGPVGDIVVTATRRSESLQKVPISLQALSPETLQQHQVAAFADYVQMLPSVSFATLGPGRSNLYFRGISVGGGQLPTVGVYLNDIPVTQAGRMLDPHMYDIERVEALSGPQGTLFGASSLAGTLRIITNKAKIGKFEAGYDVQLNKFGKGDFGQMFEGFVNLPVNDKIAVRLMGYYKKEGGYIDNVAGSLTYKSIGMTINNSAIAQKDYNPNYEFGGRATATIQLNDDWSIVPELTYQNLNSKGGYNYDPDVGDLKVHDYSETYNKDKWAQAALTIHGKIADFDVVSATGYLKRKIRNANDYTYYTVTYDGFAANDPGYMEYMKFTDKTTGKTIDPTQKYLGHLRQQKFTQELRISTPKDWKLQMTVGGFYQFQKNQNDGSYYISGLSNATSLGIAGGGLYSPALPGVVNKDAFYIVENDQHYKDGAIFAEANYEILNNVKLNGGIRYFITDNGQYGFNGIWRSARSTTTARSLVTGQMGCGFNAASGYAWNHPYRLSCINTSIGYHQVGETHKLGVSWQVQPSKMVYFTYSTGFRPGGASRLAGSKPYVADTLSNFEVGFKTSWGSNFRLNGAVYMENWNGIQYGVVPFGFQGAGVTVNAGNAKVYGVELDGTLKLGKLTLSGSGAYNDAKLSTNFCNLDPVLRVVSLSSCDVSQAGTVAAAKGTRLPRQPKLKMQGSARYETTLGDYDAFLQGTMFYQTNSTSDLDTYKNSLLGNTKGFASFDFSAGIKKDQWNAEIFVQNLFDKRGILSKNTFCSIEYCADSARSFPIKPQFYGVKFGHKF
ncbi:TonB-dependent receptor [Novosphingobium umbonatum]|uniref:TonB-dependent receptor n=1 Tax=Novosphingobium umbonatum TaxID=1908524 RepID=A0A3S2UXG5_9SPHN|nr:TonB-dependent receptor [Novosphingobium umbonatum]RVU07673.1 TonB-dependent receptor [Novosphingobium umbonatum]